jgi:MFS transporter, DHA2 family, multidrug resistance protein
LFSELMASIPKENAGVGSAVNNAISRVGPQLAGAAIFIVIAGTFYSSIERQVPEIAIQAEGFREQVSPLNAPPDSLPAPILAATKTASAEAFHLGMFIAAGLLFAGAAVNGIWLSKPSPEAAESDPGDCVSLRFCAEPARSQVLASGEVT